MIPRLFFLDVLSKFVVIVPLNPLSNIQFWFYKISETLFYEFLMCFTDYWTTIGRISIHPWSCKAVSVSIPGDLSSFYPGRPGWFYDFVPWQRSSMGTRNGLVLHSWPHELRKILQISYTHLYSESLVVHIIFEIPTWEFVYILSRLHNILISHFTVTYFAFIVQAQVTNKAFTDPGIRGYKAVSDCTCSQWNTSYNLCFWQFLPEASFGLWVLSLPASVCAPVCASVSPSVRHQVCSCDNSSPVQARITKFGP